MKQVLIFGGTFDPPHLGHVKIPCAAMSHLGFDGVLYVPAFQSPLKESESSSSEHRLTMLTLALVDASWASISTLEIERTGTSYTIDTLEALQSPDTSYRLLIGADQWAQFASWHRYEDILKLANPVVLPRDGFESNDPRVLQIEALTASSSSIRERIQGELPVNDLVSPKVAAYITEHGLYQ